MVVGSATGNIIADAVTLAGGAYNDTPSSSALGWQPLGPADLGIPATGSFDGTTYRFANGVYVDTDAASSAVAHVYLGELRGETTFAIAFRGTDEVPGDVVDHLHFSDHYAQFQPLMAAIQSYVDDPSHGVDQVLVTGHSLGAGMVTTAMIEEGWVNDSKYLGVAIASHGADASVAATAPPAVTNLVNFVHTQDFLILGQESGLPGSAFADLFGSISTAVHNADFEAKVRVGKDVWIETGNAARLFATPGGSLDDAVTAEHRIGRYEADIRVPLNSKSWSQGHCYLVPSPGTSPSGPVRPTISRRISLAAHPSTRNSFP